MFRKHPKDQESKCKWQLTKNELVFFLIRMLPGNFKDSYLRRIGPPIYVNWGYNLICILTELTCTVLATPNGRRDMGKLSKLIRDKVTKALLASRAFPERT